MEVGLLQLLELGLLLEQLALSARHLLCAAVAFRFLQIALSRGDRFFLALNTPLMLGLQFRVGAMGVDLRQRVLQPSPREGSESSWMLHVK